MKTRCKAALFCLVVCLWLVSQAQAATYYISPTGSNGAAGTSSGAPWLTFVYALGQMSAGDTLTLVDGTYTAGNSGFPSIDCSSGSPQGSSGAHVTIQALNDRKAFLSGDGTGDGAGTFSMYGCNYYDIYGLRIESADADSASPANAVYMANVTNINFKRNLVRFNNRWGNTHLMVVESLPAASTNVNDILVEDNEFYSFHRHGLVFDYCTANCTVRRNYFNSRDHVDLTPCEDISTWTPHHKFCSGDPDRGEAGIAFYPTNGAISENNIFENTQHPIEINALFGFYQNNKSYGDIVINTVAGMVLDAREDDTATGMPTNTFFTNYVFIGGAISAAGWGGIYSQSAKNTQCNNCSFISYPAYGVRAFIGGNTGDGTYSLFITNSLFLSNDQSWSLSSMSSSSEDYVRLYNNTSGPSPNDATHQTTTDPTMGSCYLWIPDASNLKNAVSAGIDIGANVLYEYASGSLTATKLWNTSTNKWAKQGATVAGVNDVAGSSLDNVPERLKVGNANGCDYPSGYAGTLRIKSIQN